MTATGDNPYPIEDPHPAKGCRATGSTFRHGLSRPWRMVGMSVVTALVLLLFLNSIVHAEMYLCRDESGAVNFTNVPNGSDCKTFDLQKENGSWAGVVPSRPDSSMYDREILRVSRIYNIDPSLIKAIIHTESDFDHRAVSRSGAQGLMQLMPDTARDLQVDNPFNPWENIEGGTRYFRSILDSFNDDLILSLAAYNAGPGLVARTGGVPRIPETLRYVSKVLKRYKVYRAAGYGYYTASR